MNAPAARSIGSQGLHLPPLGLGTATFGWLYSEVNAEQARATVHAALEAGVTYIDTAPSYGLGRAETKLGAALAGVEDQPIVSTKVGRVLQPLRPGDRSSPPFPGAPALVSVPDWTEDGILRCLDDSLSRLGLDHVDIVYLHDPDRAEESVHSTAYPALARLRDEGVVKAIGVGMNQVEMPTRIVQRLDLDVVLIAGRYTLLDHSALAAFLPACMANDVAVVAAGVFNSGVLADPHTSPTYSYQPAPEPIRERAAQIAGICSRHRTTLATAAIHFALAHPAVVTALLGMRSTEEVTANVQSLQCPPPASFWDELKELEFIPEIAPVPQS